jgi:fatty acid desaturase
MNLPRFRYPDGLLPNALAISYTLFGWCGGVAMLAAAPGAWKMVGGVLTAHTLIFAAYFIHEFAHQSIFLDPADNRRWGSLMSWLTGSCYANFEDLRHKHMRHHVDRADVLTYDYKAWLVRHPGLRRLVVVLEWAYVPAVEFIMHGYVMLLPFVAEGRSHRRGYVLGVFVVRAAAFALLGAFSPAGLVGYALAWMVMLHVLRFVDAYQHTYDAFAVLQGGEIPEDKVRDRAYEQRNTYSNVVFADWPLANLVVLNFTYHNAHHARPIEPWYRLPALHDSLFAVDDRQVLAWSRLASAYHRYRVRRLVADDYGDVVETADGRLDPGGFFGAVGVSFLTAV